MTWAVALAALAWFACDERDSQPTPTTAGMSRDNPDARPATAPAVRRMDEPPKALAGGSANAIANTVAGGVGAVDERPRVPTRTDDFHLDQSEPPAPRAPPISHPPTVERRPIHIKLLSTPIGALAAVDGAPIGRTPAFWQGEFTGKSREFTFVLPGHAMARYRFVPTTSGVVHGTLVKIAAEPNPRPDAQREPAPPTAP